MAKQPDPTEALRRIDRALRLCRSVEESNQYAHPPAKEPTIPIELIRRALLNSSGRSLDDPTPPWRELNGLEGDDELTQNLKEWAEFRNTVHRRRS